MKNKSFQFGAVLGQALARGLLSALATATALLFTTPAQAMPTIGNVGGGAYSAPFYGYIDGQTTTGTASDLFHAPSGLALDKSESYLFVADCSNNIVRMLDLSAGTSIPLKNLSEVSVSNVLNHPIAVVADQNDYIYVLNRGNGTNGSVITFDWYSPYYYAVPVLTNAFRLTNAAGMALDQAGNIYVTVQSNQLIRIDAGTTNRTLVATITNPGTYLRGITVRHSGLIAACDSGRNGIYTINPTNGVAITNAGFNGVGDFATNSANVFFAGLAKFNQPMCVAEAGDGTLVVSDFANNRVKAVLTSGMVTNLYGVNSNYWSGNWPGWQNGASTVPDSTIAAWSRMPYGITIKSDGTIYTSEDYYHLVRKLTGTGLPGPLPYIPNIPTVTSVASNYTSVTLTWNFITGATNYNVYRSQIDGTAYALIGQTSTNSYTDTTANSGAVYYYVVTASNAGGESGYSGQVFVNVPIQPASLPLIGYLTFTTNSTDGTTHSFFNPLLSPAQTFNNDKPIVIVSPDISAILLFNYGGTGSTIGWPTTNGMTANFGYHDDMSFDNAMKYALTGFTPLPDTTIYAVASKVASLTNTYSSMAYGRILYVAASPSVSGNNAAQFTVADDTTGAQMFYTIDGSEPTNNFSSNSVSVGPIFTGTTLSLHIITNTTFKIKAFRKNYQPSSTFTVQFSPTNYAANTITFGFGYGEGSSDFVASPGQAFVAPVTLSMLNGAKIYSLQFDLTVTNIGTHPVSAGANYVGFGSYLMKPTVDGFYTSIPPYAFASYFTNGIPADYTNVVFYNGAYYQNLESVDSSVNILAVGWLERFTQKNLYDTAKQDLITFSMAHDILYPNDQYPGQVEVGGYAFRVPLAATSNDVYRISITLPSATSDGIGAPGSSVYIDPTTNGSVNGSYPINSIKNVTVGQRKYVVGSVYPFRWFNAGDFGSNNIANPDVMQVFQSAVYGFNTPFLSSDFFDAMDSSGNIGALDTDAADPNYGYYTNSWTYPIYSGFITTNYTYVYDTNALLVSTTAQTITNELPIYLTSTYVTVDSTNTVIINNLTQPNSTNITLVGHQFPVTSSGLNLFSTDSSDINKVAFGDGVLDVCDVYITFQRSAFDRTWYRRFWNNGVRVAEVTANQYHHIITPSIVSSKASIKASSTSSATNSKVIFQAGDIVGSAGQTIQVPINATILGSYPLRLLMLNLTVTPLDGAPALTTQVSFAQNSALGTPDVGGSSTNALGNYSAAWLNTGFAGFIGTVNLGTLTVTIPAGAPASAAYAVTFDHASASPNGLASFPNSKITGLVTLASRTNSCYNDGIPDSWRLRWFGTTNNVLSSSNACPSGDGINNFKKFVAGVDPNTANNFPSVVSKTTPSGYSSAVTWPSVLNKQYVIERSSSLFNGPWATISTNTGTGGNMEFDDTNTVPVRFYRVRILP